MPDYQPHPADAADTAAIFQSWQLAGLTLKNRLLRSSISGRIDNYDGSGTPARVNFEERFARGGVAAIISSHVPITPKGRVLTNYAMIDRDERIDFWRTVGQRVHAHGCKFFLQLSHSGRQQDSGCRRAQPIAPTSLTACSRGVRPRRRSRTSSSCSLMPLCGRRRQGDSRQRQDPGSTHRRVSDRSRHREGPAKRRMRRRHDSVS